MLNEKALARAMLEAWKSGGYVVGRFQKENKDTVVMIAPAWQLACRLQALPRKCLGLIAEHCGQIPEESAVRCMKDGEQVAILDMVKGVCDDLLQLRIDAEGCMMRTGVTVGGWRAWQDADTWTIRLMDPGYTAICQLEDGDADAEMVKGGILFTDPETTLFVRKEDAEDYRHILQCLSKIRL